MQTAICLRLVGVLCVVLISAQVSCQFPVEFGGSSWERYNQAGMEAYQQGNYAEAESLYRRALVIYEKALDPEHPEMARGLNNLAELYRAQGKYAEAEPLY